MLTRRELIKTGLGGLAVLALANCARSQTPGTPPFDDLNYDYRYLSAADRAMMAAIASVMLAGALPDDPAANVQARIKAVRGVDVAIGDLPPGMRGEISQLFGLLEFPVTRALAAGIWSSWEDATPADIEKFLNRWRFSGIALLRSGYQGLHQLVMAAWYGNGASWARIGYPGPPRVG